MVKLRQLPEIPRRLRRSMGRGRSRPARIRRPLVWEVLEDRRVLASWVPVGPNPIVNGGTENVAPMNSVNGAMHAVVAHPTNPDIVYVATVNGGVWKTTNATDTNPNWFPLTDDMPSLSIADIEMDPANPNTLLAGVGRPSAFAGEGGELTGLMLTRDAGATWTQIQDPLFAEKEFSAVHVAGNLLLGASNGGFTDVRDIAAFFGVRTGGLFRSTDGGVSWSSIEVLDRDPNRPNTPARFNALDLVADPTDPDRFYLSVQDEGIFRSDDAGATWNNINDSRIQSALDTIELGLDDDGNVITALSSPGTNNNTELGIGSDGRLFAGIMENGQVEYIGYTDDGGMAWTQMDLPFTPDLEGTNLLGIQPEAKEGAQGLIHFSLAVDPTNSDIVYVGGDRQGGNTLFPNGNSIGAKDSVGRLFRGDASVEPLDLGFNVTHLTFDDPSLTFGDLLQFVSPQWEHLTHARGVIFSLEGGTARRSAPHADSRGFAFDANGDLIEVDDGGIFRRTNPQDNTGDWFSMAGDIHVAEMHNIAYDNISNILLGGTQDNSSIQQLATGSAAWEPVVVPNIGPVRAGGDGGDVAIDDTSTPGFSTRYSSAQFAGAFRRQVYDANNILVNQTILGGINAALVGGGTRLLTQDELFFTTPLELNRVDPTRLLVATRLGLFESFNQGDLFFIVPGTDQTNPIGPPLRVLDDQNAIVYGGHRYGTENLGLTYWAVEDEVLVRTALFGTQNLTVAQFPGGFIRDLTINDNEWRHLFVVSDDAVMATQDLGRNWSDITGNLDSFDHGLLRSVVFVPGVDKSALVVGANRGIYVTSTDDLGNWSRLGDNLLPNAPVYDLEYDQTDDVLVAALFGRGAWMLEDVAAGITDQHRLSSVPTNAISGLVWNDADGSGFRGTNESGLSSIRVFADVNRNGLLESPEPFTYTTASGSYTLRLPGVGTYAIDIEVPSGFRQTGGLATAAADVGIAPGEGAYGLHFSLQSLAPPDPGPGPGPTPGPTQFPGVIRGLVFRDLNNNGTRDMDEPGIPNALAFVDLNDSCAIGSGEPSAVSDSMGRFTITNVPPGSHTVRLTPQPGVIPLGECNGLVVDVDQNGTASTSPQFPIGSAVDFGEFSTGSHGVIPGFRLGAIVMPDPDGDVDDNDGVFFVTGLHPGRTETVSIEAHQLAISPGYLQGWIDFNNDLDFDDNGEQIFRNVRLAEGVNNLMFQVPATVVTASEVRARFRWGLERNLSATATAAAGEIEDYFLTIPSEGDSGLTANDDQFTVTEDSAGTLLNVLMNDMAGVLGGSFAISTLGTPNQGGQVVVAPSGQVVYSPAANFFGTELFTYTIRDTSGGTSTATVTVTVTNVNDAPSAVPDSFLVPRNATGFLLRPLENDTDVDGDVLRISGLTMPSQGGVASIAPDGVVYSPPTNFVGTETFNYTITDDNGGFSTATITVNVLEQIPPQVTFRLEIVDQNGMSVDLLGVGDTFVIRAFVEHVEQPPVGVFSAYLDVTYDPALANSTGAITFAGSPYTGGRSGSLSTPGLIDEVGGVDGLSPLGAGEFLVFSAPFVATAAGVLTVGGNVADAIPLHDVAVFGASEAVDRSRISFSSDSVQIIVVGAVNDAFAVPENSTNNLLDVLDNDGVRPGFGPLRIISVGVPNQGGMVSIVNGDFLQYQPRTGFIGTETFSYTISDAVGSQSSAMVTITVTDTNSNPTAVADQFEVLGTDMSVVLDVLANDTFAPDVMETLTITNVTVPSAGGEVAIAGDGQSLLYTPPSGFSGQETFTYTIMDNRGGTASAGVTVSIIDALVNLRLEVTDPNGTPISSIVTTQTFLLRGFVEDVRQNPTGVASAYLDVLYASANVIPSGAITFGPEYTGAQSGDTTLLGIINELGAVAGSTIPLGGGEFLLFEIPFTAVTAGLVNFTGDPADIIPLHETTLFGQGVAVDPGLIRFQNISLEVRNPGAADDRVSVLEDSGPNTLFVLANDPVLPGQEPLLVESVGMAMHGTVQVGMGNLSVIYTPKANFFGTDTFTYRARDAQGTLTQATVFVSVTNTGDQPQALAAMRTVGANTIENRFDLLQQVTDIDLPDDDLLISDVGVPSMGGSVEIAADGKSVVYEPPSGFLGTETFNYTVTDRFGLSSTATVSVNVVAQAPDLVEFSFNVTDILGNDTSVVQQGDRFLVQVFVEDLREIPFGVFSAYLDMTYGGTGLVSVDGPLQFNDAVFPTAQRGDTSASGLVNELGAVDGTSPTLPAGPVLLVTIPFLAELTGNISFAGDAADLVPPNETTMFGLSFVVPPDLQSFVGTVVTIAPAAPSAYTNNDNPFDVNEDTQITPLDALLVINDLSRNGARLLPPSSGSSKPAAMVDVNRDRMASPLDAVLVINELSRPSGELQAPKSGGVSAGASGVDRGHDAVFASLAMTDGNLAGFPASRGQPPLAEGGGERSGGVPTALRATDLALRNRSYSTSSDDTEESQDTDWDSVVDIIAAKVGQV